MLAVSFGIVLALWMVNRSPQPVLFKYESFNTTGSVNFDDDELFYPYMEDLQKSKGIFKIRMLLVTSTKLFH